MGRYTWRQGAIIYEVHRRIEARARLTRLSVERINWQIFIQIVKHRLGYILCTIMDTHRSFVPTINLPHSYYLVRNFNTVLSTKIPCCPHNEKYLSMSMQMNNNLCITYMDI